MVFLHYRVPSLCHTNLVLGQPSQLAPFSISCLLPPESGGCTHLKAAAAASALCIHALSLPHSLRSSSILRLSPPHPCFDGACNVCTSSCWPPAPHGAAHPLSKPSGPQIPTAIFLYIAGYIGSVGREYLVAVRGEKKPVEKEIIIDVPLALKLAAQGAVWPLRAIQQLRNGSLLESDDNITVSPR